jgi:hypothetical protein
VGDQLGLAASILANLRVAVVTDEKPTQFTLRVEATGLPNVPEAVRKFAAAKHSMRPEQRISEAKPQAVELAPTQAEQQ